MTSTEPTGQTYNIDRVEDLLKLDERQLDACLADMKTWVQFRKNFDATIDKTIELIQSMTGQTREEILTQLKYESHMKWIDDGVDGGSVKASVYTEEEGEPVAVFNVPGDLFNEIQKHMADVTVDDIASACAAMGVTVEGTDEAPVQR